MQATAPTAILRWVTAHLDDMLDSPLREVLTVMQQRIVRATTYHGIRALKNPLDFWCYHQLIHRTRPDVVIEIGNNWGGSTLALAHVLDLIDHGRVIGIDIDHSRIAAEVRAHDRITLVEMPAIDAYEQVRARVAPDEGVLVIEDSSHTYDHTLAVLERYGQLVEPGGHLIVEDSICHHGLDVGPHPGPFEAVHHFVERHPEFEIDRDLETFLITWNPCGFLSKVA